MIITDQLGFVFFDTVEKCSIGAIVASERF